MLLCFAWGVIFSAMIHFFTLSMFIFMIFAPQMGLSAAPQMGVSVPINKVKWEKWARQAQEKFNEPLATPSIVQHIYLPTMGSEVYFNEGDGYRISKAKCPACKINVRRTGKERVLLTSGSNQSSLNVGDSSPLDEKKKYYISVHIGEEGTGIRLFLHDLNQGRLDHKRIRHFFPYANQYIINAHWHWLAEPKAIVIPRSDGSKKSMNIMAELKISDEKGQLISTLSVYDYGMPLKEFMASKYTMLTFRDSTNGSETYGAGRFLTLNLERPIKNMKDGDTVPIDFNFSYNPPCAVSQGFHCPLPQNYVNMHLKAGEQYQK
jgi:hypothetical protein